MFASVTTSSPQFLHPHSEARHGRSQAQLLPRRHVARNLPVIQPDAVAIDAGSAQHFIAVPPDRDPSRPAEYAQKADNDSRF